MTALEARQSWGLLSLSFSRFLEAAAAGIVLVAIPLSIKKSADLASLSRIHPTAAAGILIGVFGLALALGQPLAGYLADRFSNGKSLAAAGLFLLSLATVAFSFAKSWEAMVFLRVGQGVSMSLVVPTTTSLVAGLSPRTKVAGAFGFFSSFRMLGFCVGPLLGASLLDAMDLAQTYWLGAALVLGSCLFLLLTPAPASLGLPERPAARDSQPMRLRFGEMTPFLFLGLGAFAASSSATSLFVLQSDLSSKFHPGNAALGLALSAMLLTRIFLQWPIGKLADRVSSKTMIAWGLSLLGAGTLLQGTAESVESLILLRIIAGVGMALFFCAAIPFALQAKSEGGARHFTLSLVTAGFSLGISLGPLLTGWLAGRFGYQAPFWVWGALLLAVLAAVLLGLTGFRARR